MQGSNVAECAAGSLVDREIDDNDICRCADTMSFVGDKADKMAEKAAFEAGGYPGLIKFKAFRAYQAIKECSCCA
eukprot:scaffold148362_cov36-Cyclotella_meneghiniana.AAC.1